MKEEIAKKLLEIDAVSLTNTENLFTWVSGIKSPIYCDNRLIMSYPSVRNIVAEGLKDLITQHYPEVEVIAGTATAGIPHAAWTSHKMELPMIYVRNSSKDHGKENQIEGKLNKGQKVVVVEDLLSTGGSSAKVVKAVENAGGIVLGIVAIFTYGFKKMKDNLEAEGIDYHTLTDYDCLLKVAEKLGKISKEDELILSEWSKNPYIFTKN